MEDLTLWLWITIATACLGYILMVIFKYITFAKAINKMPGPKSYPLFGNINEMGFGYKAMKLFEPNAILAEIRYGLTLLFGKEKIIKLWFFHRPIVFLYSAEAVEPVLTSNVSINKSIIYKLMEPWLGQGLVTSSGSKWRKRRKMLTPTFHFQILQDFLPIMNDHAAVLIKKLEEESKSNWVDAFQKLSLCTLDIICETAMGISISAQNDSESEYVKAIHSVTHAIVRRAVRPWLWNDFIYGCTKDGKLFKKDIQTLHSFTNKVIAERKESRKNNENETETDSSAPLKKRRLAFLDMLLDKHFADGSLTEEDIREEVDTFMFGGHDTTATAMSWALYLLGLNPDVQQKLQEEVDYVFGENRNRDATLEDIKELRYMDMVMKESQRLYPSIPGVSRIIEEDILIKGYTLPKGTAVHIFTYAMNRDPEVFPNPEVFDPDRFLPENSIGRHPYAFVPFSAGPRNCIGQKYALMEQKVLLSFIFRNFTVTSLDQRDQMSILFEVVSRPSKPLRTKFDRRPSY